MSAEVARSWVKNGQQISEILFRNSDWETKVEELGVEVKALKHLRDAPRGSQAPKVDDRQTKLGGSVTMSKWMF